MPKDVVGPRFIQPPDRLEVTLAWSKGRVAWVNVRGTHGRSSWKVHESVTRTDYTGQLGAEVIAEVHRAVAEWFDRYGWAPGLYDGETPF